MEVTRKINENSQQMEESLRAIRTNIKFCGENIKTICFTSVYPNEGKSTVVLKLAESFAKSGNKVLVVDTDMRKSQMVGRNRFHTTNQTPIVGLSQYLSGQNSLEEVVYQYQNLSLIFAGHMVANATELLEKKFFSILMERAKEKFDYVLVDCAPTSAAIDVAIVAKSCDGVVFVVEQNKVSPKELEGAKKQMEASGTKVLGAVLNKVKTEHNAYSYYYRIYGENNEK